MTRAAVCVAFVGVLCLSVGVDARAEPIRITGGFLDFNRAHVAGPATRAGELSVIGTRGFSADGFVDSSETKVDLARFPIEAGSTIPTGVGIMGLGFLPVKGVTLDGKSYTDINGLNSTDLLFIELTGTIDIPAWQNASVTISAPFGATGNFHYVLAEFSVYDVPIRGGGTVTLNLAPEPGGTWASDTFRYDFVATPTPEPATLTMVGGALFGAVIRARRRRDA